MDPQQLLSVWVVDTAADSAPDARGEPAVAVVRVCGEVDLSTAPVLAATLDRVLTATPDRDARPVVVDCSAMTFCGARGLDVLHGAAARASERDLGYAVVGLSARLVRLGVEVWPGRQPARYRRLTDAINAVRVSVDHGPS